jgi:hypothetical protein
MSSNNHILLQKAFTELGLKANRSNSIFCSCRYHTANDWGYGAYAIFVKNGWSGTVFKKLKDQYAYNRLSGYTQDMNHAMQKIEELGPMEISTTGGLMEVLRGNYKDVLITGSSYIAIQGGGVSALLPAILGFNPSTAGYASPF